MDLILFVTVAALVIVMPGPNVMIIVATSLTQGRHRGLQTVAGTSTAMLLQLAIAALGTSWLVEALARGFVWLKWAGVLYLSFLGLRLLLTAAPGSQTETTAAMSWQRGFWVSLTNPKTILFFSAFLPQFVDPAAAYLPQIALLSVIFWLLAVALDSVYALSAATLHLKLSDLRTATLARRGSGLLYLGAGALLASLKRG